MVTKVKKWKRNCPECGKEITYTTRRAKIRAEKRNTKCRSYTKKGENNPMYGKTPWNKEKMNVYSEESLLRMSESKLGKNNSMYGKFGMKRSDETRKKMSENHSHYWTGKKQSEESNKKRRLSTIKRIEKNKLDGNQFYPNHNSVGCDVIRWFNMYYDFNFQHAENGGEVCIDGYYPDGVDEERKTIIEVDESHHFNAGGARKEKDIRRQSYLEDLGYKFIRIKI